MRLLIPPLALVLLPVFVGAHFLIFRAEQQPHLAGKVREALRLTGVKRGDAKMNYLDATVTGVAQDVAMREAAGVAVAQVRGIRFSPTNNRIVVPAHVNAALDDKRLSLTGWLPDERSVQSFLKIVKEHRPDLEIDAKKLRVSPFVITGDAENVALSEKHRLLRPVLDAIRVPASLSVTREGDTFVVQGYLPSEEMRNEIIDAVQDNPGGWKTDVAKLVATRFVAESGFTRSNALPRFLKSYFSSPEPGTFSINGQSGPVLVADATREMEAEWLTLLRAVSGGAKVDARLTIYPSIYHLPGYRPQSQVPAESAAALRPALDSATVFFENGSTTLAPDEECKLRGAAPAILAGGQGLHLLIGYIEQSDPASNHLARERAALVRETLMDLGVGRNQLEIVSFNEVPDASANPAEQTRIARRIELQIK